MNTALDSIAQKLQQTQKFWLAFTGDSITSCEWVHPNWREIVEYVLKEEMTKILGDWKLSEWGIRCFNWAFDGSTTKDISDRVDLIIDSKPDMVIGLMGGNDPILGLSVEDTNHNIAQIINKLTSQDISVVWCTTTPANNVTDKNEMYKPYAEAVMLIKPQDYLQLIDMFNIYKQFPLEKFYTFKSEDNPDEGMKAGDPDYWHPNQLGNAYITKVILSEVFGIKFDPEKYISDTNKGKKYPGY